MRGRVGGSRRISTRCLVWGCAGAGGETRRNGPRRREDGSEVCEDVPTLNVASKGTAEALRGIPRHALGCPCVHEGTGTVFRRYIVATTPRIERIPDPRKGAIFTA